MSKHNINVPTLILLTILAVLALYGLGFLVIAGLYWIVCWAFGFIFSWKFAIGIFVIYTVLCTIARCAKGGSK